MLGEETVDKLKIFWIHAPKKRKRAPFQNLYKAVNANIKVLYDMFIKVFEKISKTLPEIADLVELNFDIPYYILVHNMNKNWPEKSFQDNVIEFCLVQTMRGQKTGSNVSELKGWVFVSFVRSYKRIRKTG